MSREKKAVKPVTIGIIIVCLLLIMSLIRNAVGLYQSRSRLESTKAKVTELETQKQAAKQKLRNQTDPAALDQTIRNKLNLSKPGETVIVISGTQSADSSVPAPTPTAAPTAAINEWWQLVNPAK